MIDGACVRKVGVNKFVRLSMGSGWWWYNEMDILIEYLLSVLMKGAECGC